MQIQDHTNKIINSRIVTGNFSNLVTKWFINNNSDDFNDIWVIVKTTPNQSNLYCGKNVPWINSHFNIPNKLPNYILVIEDSYGKGILLGDTIMNLIQLGDMGIFLWITPTSSIANQTLLQYMNSTGPYAPNIGFVSTPMYSGSVCIGVGGSVMQLPSGGTVQIIKHNAFQPLSNISWHRNFRTK
jgi:hypothetical protein